MFKFLGKNWAWILFIIAAIVATISVIVYLEEIKVWIQAHWFIFPMLMIPSYSAGIFINSFTIRSIITQARGTGQQSYGVNFGELAAIDITDKTRDNLWLHGGLVVLSISGIILLIILL
jgi:hypothetical protein